MHTQIRPRAKPFLDINVLHTCFPSLQMMASVKLAREICNNNAESKSETKCPTWKNSPELEEAGLRVRHEEHEQKKAE